MRTREVRNPRPRRKAIWAPGSLLPTSPTPMYRKGAIQQCALYSISLSLSVSLSLALACTQQEGASPPLAFSFHLCVATVGSSVLLLPLLQRVLVERRRPLRLLQGLGPGARARAAGQSTAKARAPPSAQASRSCASSSVCTCESSAR